ncbi:hypothetical protein [Plantactinospora sp. CA-290183]|uniref:hypothetical protein n=1 Tax=Plantactinospora sp. CA-290183 TaxID=3240006 RepID=UPI003D8F1B06
MGELANFIPAGGVGAFGVGGLLVMVVGYLLNANRADRKEYQEAIDKAEKRADEAARRTDAAEQRAEGLQQAVDEARSARRATEDRLAILERELARHRSDGPR